MPFDELPPSVVAAIETSDFPGHHAGAHAGHDHTHNGRGHPHERGGHADGRRGRRRNGPPPRQALSYTVTHPLQLRPALPSEGVTSMQDGWADTVDHIFYSESHLTPIAVLALVSHGQLVAEGGMPSALEPSDHQLIAVRFAFVDRLAPRR